MKFHSVCWISALGAVVEFSHGVTATRYAGWFGNRGVQVQNIIAMEGGYIIDGGSFNNGQFATATVGNQTQGVYLQLDLSQPFNGSSPHDQMFTFRRDLIDADSQSFVNGHMFHSNRSWFTFGGQTGKPKPYDQANSVRRGTLPAFGVSTVVDFASGSTTTVDGAGGVHENITMGAYASSPDPGQARGWMLGGMSRSDYAWLRYPLRTNDTGVVLAQDFFYEVNMQTEIQATFSTLKSPLNAYGLRAQGGLVWLPFGNQGILLALGGLTYPPDLFPAGSAPTIVPTNNTFMSNLLIYDIASQNWYNQTTLENGVRPGQLGGFCTAVVATTDNLSQQVIVYGGSDGSGKGNPKDDVWMLSIPAFEWTLVKSGNDASHGRRGSNCFAPNPTSFLTIGGSKLGASPLGSDTFIDVFDLNSLSWTGRWDPSSNATFAAPAAVVSQLKWPDNKGPGTRTVGNVNDPALRSLLSTAYPTVIKSSYPYASPSTTTAAPPGSTSTTPPERKHSNTALIASLATVIPVVIIAALVAFFCLRRRKQRNNRTRGKDSDVNSWVNKVGRDEKSNGYSETTAVDSPYDDFGGSPVLPAVARKNTDIYEAPHTTARASAVQSPDLSSYKQADREYHELDNDPRGPTALSSHPTNINGQHSDIRSELGSDKHASELPQASSRENLSVPVGGVVAGTSQPSSISRKPVADRRDSTPLPSPATPNMGHTRGTSDVSSAALTASPNTDFRRSQYIDGLPEQPGHLGEGRSTPTAQGRASAYKENI